jgi:hypothetical protein
MERSPARRAREGFRRCSPLSSIQLAKSPVARRGPRVHKPLLKHVNYAPLVIWIRLAISAQPYDHHRFTRGKFGRGDLHPQPIALDPTT